MAKRFTGYSNRPDPTAQTLRDGWYRSGDLEFAGGDELYVVGRKKAVIIVAGKNIHQTLLSSSARHSLTRCSDE